MSNFTCGECGTDIIDSETGYITGYAVMEAESCDHYEPIRFKMRCAISRGFAPRDCGSCKFFSKAETANDR